MNIVKKSVTIGGKELTFETGKLAKQASGAVIVGSGESKVLVTAVAETDSETNFDFPPAHGELRRPKRCCWYHSRRLPQA